MDIVLKIQLKLIACGSHGSHLQTDKDISLYPCEPTQDMIDKAVCDTPETPSQDYWHDSQPISDDQTIACYKAMIGEETK